MPTPTTAPSAGTGAHAHDAHRDRRCGAAGVLDTHRSYVVDPIDLLHARQHNVPQAILDEYPPPASMAWHDCRKAIDRLPVLAQRPHARRGVRSRQPQATRRHRGGRGRGRY